MHDPRIGRFFAVDPLTKKYPHYSPYSFSGNKVISFVELEGLEEAMIVGSQRQVNKVNEFNSRISDKPNWGAVKFINLEQAKQAIHNHKNVTGDVLKVLLIQAHAGEGFINVFPGSSSEVNTKAGDTSPGNQPLLASRLYSYLIEMQEVNSIKNVRKRQEKLDYYRGSEYFKQAEQFLGLVDEIVDGGTLILNGCHVFSGEYGKQFSDYILIATGKKINIIGARDLVSDVNPKNNGKEIFGGGLTPELYQFSGYMHNSEPTGKDLQLNGTKDKPPFEFVPFDRDLKENEEK